MADFCKLNNGDIANAFENPLDIVDIDASNTDLGKKIVLRNNYSAGAMQVSEGSMESSASLYSSVPASGCDYTTKRALMAKDVVRTIMAIAGVEDKFGTYYVGDFFKDAQVIKKLVSS